MSGERERIRIDVLTLFPELFGPFLATSLLGRAREAGAIALEVRDLRDWATDRHRVVDDVPYGGGPGMVLKPEPLVAAIEALAGPKGAGRSARVVLMSPQGERLDQERVHELAGAEHLVLVCARYEGVDQRAIDLAVDLELSIGDYVLQGGEIPAMAVVEAVSRLVPGVLGNPASAETESFRTASLEGPQFTRPAVFARPRGARGPPLGQSRRHRALEGGACARADETPASGSAPRTRRGIPMNSVEMIERASLRRDLPPFRTGDTVRVHVRVREGDKERTQVFEGVVIRRRRGGTSASFTVRKVSYGVGVERIFPVESPSVQKIEIKSRGHVRRSRLYYLRELRGKKARLRSKLRDLSQLLSPEEMEAGTADAAAAREEEAQAEAEAAAAADAPAAEAAADDAPAAGGERGGRPRRRGGCGGGARRGRRGRPGSAGGRRGQVLAASTTRRTRLPSDARSSGRPRRART